MMIFSHLTTTDIVWLTIGFGGQALFSMRFLLQWIHSERQKKSVFPVAFWYFSIFGSISLLVYAIHKRDPVFTMGQLFGVFVYSRNLYFIFQEKKNAAQNTGQNAAQSAVQSSGR